MDKPVKQLVLIVMFILVAGCSVVELLHWSKPTLEPSGKTSFSAEANLLDTLRAYGLEPEVQNTYRAFPNPSDSFNPNSWWPVTRQNVIVRIPGTNNQGTIMLYAQYPSTLSAGDSLAGTGSATLLKMVQTLTKLPALQNDVVLFFSNAPLQDEIEVENFILAHPLARQCAVVLNIEDPDTTGKVMLYFSSKYNYQLVQDFTRLTHLPSPGHMTPILPDGNKLLALLQYLGNQTFKPSRGPSPRGISVLIHPQTGIYNSSLKAVDKVILEFMQKWKIPGGAVAITKDGRLVYARGFGFANQETHEVLQPERLFRIASLSKPITAVAVLQLMEEGKLGLDNFVFGPEGILADSAYALVADKRIKQITIRHLLEHSAGWDREVSGSLMFDPVNIARQMRVPPPADMKTIIRYALSRPLDFKPGSRYAYSNIGYGILGRVIEQVTGTSYEDYVKKSILNPLGIYSMRIGNNFPGVQEPEEVWYYPAIGESVVPSIYGSNIQVPFAYGGFNLEAMDAHGGWIASAPDLLRFMVAVDGFDTKPDILSPATLEQMITPTASLHSGYGLGWWVNSQNNWCHTGYLPGCSALLERTSDGYTWALLFNRGSNNQAYFDELYKLIFKGIKEVEHWPEYDLFPMVDNYLKSPIAPQDTALQPNSQANNHLLEIKNETN